ncbi:MAG: A24 family peptidase [Archangium sp.]|nr:A24 family peptidase [Archangium sp.]
MPLKHLLFALLAVTMLVAVATDVKSRRIPDLVTYPAMAVALGLRFHLEGVGELTTGLLSGLAGLGATVLWFGAFALSKKSMGWGDVKLAGVMGAALGMPLTLAAMVFVSVAGAFQAIVSLIWAGALSDTVRSVLAKKVEGDSTPKRHIPYGVAIALGSAWAMWWD